MIKYNSKLVKRCLKKDRVAQNQMYREHYDFLMAISWRYAESKEEAVEFVNLGFLKVLMNIKKYKQSVPYELWVRRVLINAVVDVLRKRKNYKEVIEIREEEKLPHTIEKEDLNDNQLEKLQWIKARSKDLPKVTSRVFNLYAFDGFKHKEIAKMLSISEGTSQWHYSIAKKKLKEMSNEIKVR